MNVLVSGSHKQQLLYISNVLWWLQWTAGRDAIFKSQSHTTGVSVLSDDPAVAAGRVEVELLSHEVAETGRVQVGAGADDAVAGEAAQLPGHVGQDVHCRGKQ